jgi:phosphoglycolate phosphatase-like HAD superfamily hydrolase
MVIAVLLDLEDTLVETVYSRLSPEVVNQIRRAVKKQIIKLGIPKKLLEGVSKHISVRNRAFEWVETNMNRKESSRFHTKLDQYMNSIEMWAAKQHTLFSDTVNGLTLLTSKNTYMGIVTNTSKEAADYLLEKYCLAKFFKVVVTRNDVHRLKPNPEMIHLAVKKMGNSIGWLIGDSDFDAEAARRADIKSIIVRRNGMPPTFKYDYFVPSLKEAASIIPEDLSLKSKPQW